MLACIRESYGITQQHPTLRLLKKSEESRNAGIENGLSERGGKAAPEDRETDSKIESKRPGDFKNFSCVPAFLRDLCD